MNRLTVLVACGIILSVGGTSDAGNWPAWRGADGRGISSDTNLPVTFGPTTNLTWKTPLAGEGNSTPIIWNNRVFVTGPREGGKIRSLICIDRKTSHTITRSTITFITSIKPALIRKRSYC